MLDIILERHVVYVLMGIFTVAGLLSKIIVSATLKKLVRAAGNMSKSSHPLMRLVRAKFEHACMVSDKVENVGVFVDKYLYEYRVLGMRIHSLQRVERVSAILCLLSGALGALAEYGLYGMSEEVLRLCGIGTALAIIVYLFQLSTDEKYRLEAARNYMVDYLENVCLHRYEKANQKEQKRKVTVQKNPEEDLRVDEVADEAGDTPDVEEISETFANEEMSVQIEEERAPEIAAAMPEANISQNKNKRQSRKIKKASRALAAAGERMEKEKVLQESIRESASEPEIERTTEADKKAAQVFTENAEHETEKITEKATAKDVLIRQILEEYMA